MKNLFEIKREDIAKLSDEKRNKLHKFVSGRYIHFMNINEIESAKKYLSLLNIFNKIKRDKDKKEIENYFNLQYDEFDNVFCYTTVKIAEDGESFQAVQKTRQYFDGRDGGYNNVIETEYVGTYMNGEVTSKRVGRKEYIE